eukprot:4599381-Ditylum_brightwellii.AAC.1
MNKEKSSAAAMPSPAKTQQADQQQGLIATEDSSRMRSSSVSFPTKNESPKNSPPSATSTTVTSMMIGGTVNNPSAAPSFSSSSSSVGDASGVTLLLSNHAKFGLFERVSYHFDLIETLKRDEKGGLKTTAKTTHAEMEIAAKSKEEFPNSDSKDDL